MNNNEKVVVNTARFFKWVISRSGPVEVRILDTLNPKSAAGYFDSSTALVKSVYSENPRPKIPFNDYRRSGEARGIYFTLNKLPPDILARSCNKIILTQTTVGDTDVERYKLVLIDADPVRLTGISSTNHEKFMASCVIRRVHHYLKKLDINHVVADSGNGFHILIPVDFEVSVENIDFVHNFLLHLHKLFTNASVKIDTIVFNPSRICKLYGTKAMTGSSTNDRPHRYSNIHWPIGKVICDVDLKNKLAGVDISPPKAETLGDHDKNQSIAKIKEILSGESIVYRIKEKGSYSVFELENCILHTDNDGHTYECCITVDKKGKYGFSCKHDDTFGWIDAKLKLNWSKYSKSSIPDNIDLNDFFNDSTSVAVPVDLTSRNDSSSDSSAVNEYEKCFAEAYNKTVFDHVNYIIPECTLAGRKLVLNVGGEQGVGKTTVMVGGFIIPMTSGQYVFGRYKCPKIKTFYINSDCVGEYFMHRFVYPYGYDAVRDRDSLLFLHTKSTPDFEITLQSIMNIIAVAIKRGYELIILDNRTTLFPKSIYGDNAQSMGLEMTDWLKKIAIKYDIAMVILDHIRKPDNRSGDFVTIHDILGSSTKSAEQVLGIQARYDVIKKPNSNEKAKRIRRQGEGVVMSLKGIDKLDKLMYRIVEDEHGMSVEYDAFDSIDVKQDPEIWQPEEKDDIKNTIYKHLICFPENSTITFADIAHECDCDLRTVTKYIEELDVYKSGINILKGKKGRGGFKNSIKIISHQKIADFTNRSPIGLLSIPLDIG